MASLNWCWAQFARMRTLVPGLLWASDLTTLGAATPTFLVEEESQPPSEVCLEG